MLVDGAEVTLMEELIPYQWDFLSTPPLLYWLWTHGSSWGSKRWGWQLCPQGQMGYTLALSSSAHLPWEPCSPLSWWPGGGQPGSGDCLLFLREPSGHGSVCLISTIVFQCQRDARKEKWVNEWVNKWGATLTYAFLSFLLLNLQLFSPLLASLVKNVLVFVVVVHFSFFLCGFKKQT